MRARFFQRPVWIKSALGAALTVLCGWLLWSTPLGEPWVNASYDYLFRFGSRLGTNQVSLILMDNAAFDEFQQSRGEPWDRALHAQLLNRLADDGCELVAMDSLFRQPRDPQKDELLATAMRRQKHLVLMAEQSELLRPSLEGVRPTLPYAKLLAAAQTNWGVGWLTPDLDGIVRKQWPFPSPGPYPSLPWKVAELLGAKLSSQPQERWVRYYDQPGPWQTMSYAFALSQPRGFFHNQIVFIGNWPKTTVADNEPDEFNTPYSRWTGETSGGVEILLTETLNLLNGDSLERLPAQVEFWILLGAGAVLGGGLWRLRWQWLAGAVGLLFVAVSLAGIISAHHTAFWFPWLVVAGGQLPCAVAWAVAVNWRRDPVILSPTAAELILETPGYELVKPSFAEGAYGKLWLARNASGQWRALKVVYQARFGEDVEPFEREYAGVQKYLPISDRHPGLLRVDFLSQKQNGCFYYVMELADSLVPGWEKDPTRYKPRDLVSERAELPKKRLPIRDCLQLGIQLCEALEFMHQQGMTHRDIKPQNIVFVQGQPKLADLGLITGIRPLGHEGTLVGTPGFMPPAPERPGTVSADIYALGMVLYVLATGRSATVFPEVATTLVSTEEPPEFLPLNSLILKACAPTPVERFASALEMRLALQTLQSELNAKTPGI